MNADSADAITDSIQKIATRLQQRGLRVIVSTIMPFHGFEQFMDGSWTPAKEETRNAVNAFIRTNQDFDGVVDFDSLLSDPSVHQASRGRRLWSTTSILMISALGDGRLLPAVLASLSCERAGIPVRGAAVPRRRTSDG